MGENVVLRGLGDCRFERANEACRSTAVTPGRQRSARPGRRDRAADPRHRQLRGHERARPRRRHVPRRPALPAGPDGHGYAAPIPLALVLRALDAVQRLGPLGRARPARHQRPAVLPHGRGPAVAHEPGEAPRLYTEADGWKTLQLNGMGIASHDLTGDGHPEVYLTSQGDEQAPDAGRRTDQTEVRGHRARAGGQLAQPFTGGDRCPQRPGIRSSRTSTTTAWSTCSCPRAMWVRWRATP